MRRINEPPAQSQTIERCVRRQRGERRVCVFGCLATGSANSESDIDLLVEMEENRSLFDLGGLLMDLRALLGCRVDVVTEAGLRPRIRERVLKEAIPL